MAEIETPPVTTDDRLVPTRTIAPGTQTILERWLETDPDAAAKKLEQMVRALDQLFALSIRRTYPSDWVLHTTVGQDGRVLRQVGYLQDCGAERAAKPWGIEVGQPVINREDFPDNTFAYHLEAEAWSKMTGETIARCEGSRWSGDKFFARQLKEEGDKVDPTDVSKAAYANLHGRAVRALTGMSAVPGDVLKANGIDLERCLGVTYDGTTGSSGAGAAAGADLTVAFGRSAGKKPADLEDKDLAWYEKAYAENVADPAKARFVKANQRVLDALRAEKERRAQGAAQDKAAQEPPPGDTGSDGKPTPIGELRGTVWTLLQDAAGKRAVDLLRAVTREKEIGGTERAAVSECEEEELRRIIALGAEPLKKLAGRLGPEAKK